MAKETKKGAADAAPLEPTTVVLGICGRAQQHVLCDAIDSDSVIIPKGIAEALLEAGLAQKV